MKKILSLLAALCLVTAVATFIFRGRDSKKVQDAELPPPAAAVVGAETPAAPAEVIIEEKDIAGPTKLPFSLVGTIVRPNKSESQASLRFESEPTSSEVRVGADLKKFATVARIERARIVIKNAQSGGYETIHIGPYDPSRAVKGDAVAPSAPKEFHVERKWLEDITSDLPKILSAARAIPHVVNGSIVGFQIVSIVPGSPFEKLGLRNGDILRGVNGESITSPAQALQAYAELRESSMVQLMVERAGVESVVTYLIR